MAKRWGSCDYKQLQKLRDNLAKLEESDLDKFCRDVSKELAARLLALVIPRTPVGKRPELSNPKTETVVGASGKKRSFLTAEGARYEQYWGGYMGGTLRRGWTARTEREAEGGNGNPSADEVSSYVAALPVVKTGKEYRIEVINPVHYASYVEFGHRQTPGRYVPAIGKALKEGWVEGQYFLTLSEQDLKGMAPGLIEKKLEKRLREVFNV